MAKRPTSRSRGITTAHSSIHSTRVTQATALMAVRDSSKRGSTHFTSAQGPAITSPPISRSIASALPAATSDVGRMRNSSAKRCSKRVPLTICWGISWADSATPSRKSATLSTSRSMPRRNGTRSMASWAGWYSRRRRRATSLLSWRTAKAVALPTCMRTPSATGVAWILIVSLFGIAHLFG